MTNPNQEQNPLEAHAHRRQELRNRGMQNPLDAMNSLFGGSSSNPSPQTPHQSPSGSPTTGQPPVDGTNGVSDFTDAMFAQMGEIGEQARGIAKDKAALTRFQRDSQAASQARLTDLNSVTQGFHQHIEDAQEQSMVLTQAIENPVLATDIPIDQMNIGYANDMFGGSFQPGTTFGTVYADIDSLFIQNSGSPQQTYEFVQRLMNQSSMIADNYSFLVVGPIVGYIRQSAESVLGTSMN